jgi:ferritin
MLISQKMTAAINEEIGRELFASNQYIAIASYLDDLALKLLAKLFFKQSDEEREHGLKFVKYLNDAGGPVEVPAISAPQNSFKSVEEALQIALKWELDVTKHINDLMSLAIEEKDYATQDLLRWFVTEQVEEVSTMENLIKVLKSAGERNVVMLEAYLAHN